MKSIKMILEFIVKMSFHLSVWLIERFYDMRIYKEMINELRKYPNETLGKEVADCLDANNLNLVPGYESHDLKHSLLDYKMTSVDEIRMQAFMLGNGNITLPSIAIFVFGFILLPHKWIQFTKDFYVGINSKSIRTWTIEEYGDKNLKELRKQVIMTDKKEIRLQPMLQRMAYAGSLASMILGALGMIYCLPFLFSSVVEDLIGAGFPFVGGAILFIGGLISLSIVNRKDKVSYKVVY